MRLPVHKKTLADLSSAALNALHAAGQVYSAMRTKATCSSRTLNVKMRSKADYHGLQTLVWELIKHLLYMRNQIPNLYEDLDWQVQVGMYLVQICCLRQQCLRPGPCMQQLQHDEHMRRQAANTALIRTDSSDDGASPRLTVAKQRKGKRRLQTSQKRLCKVQGHSCPHLASAAHYSY